MTESLATSALYTQPKRRVRAYLEAAEDYLRGFTHARQRSEMRVVRDKLSIEHLLRQQWQSSWPVADLENEIDRIGHVHVMGNLTLLTQTLNSAVSNGPWNGPHGKREALKSSDTLLLTREVRDQEVWDEDTIDDRTNRMTAALLDTWRAPADHNPEPVKRSEEERGAAVSIAGLIVDGSLPAGTLLRARGGANVERTAVVRADGKIEFESVAYDSPSAAGRACLNRTVNGWTFWRLPDGAPLDSLRTKPIR